MKLDEPMEIIGDTVAMGNPHEIEYTITFHSNTADQYEAAGDELVYERSMELQYAENFTVDYYEGGYVLLTTTMDNTQLLVVPEDKEAPKNLDEKVKVLKRPVKDIYLVASSAMDMFSALEGLDTITFSGQKEDDWYIESAREEMRKGNILYAGKYDDFSCT